MIKKFKVSVVILGLVLCVACNSNPPVSPLVETPLVSATSTPLPKTISTSTGDSDWETVYSEINEKYGRAYFAESDLSTENFTSLLAKALNSGAVKVPELSDWLNKRRFVVIEQYQTVDLFGDRRMAEVFQIEPQGSVEGSFNANQVGTVLVISQDAPEEEYFLTTLEPNWNFNQRGSQTVFINDYNGNGKSDIAQIDLVWGHRGCRNALSIFEWQDAPISKFTNVAASVEGIFGGYGENDCADRVWTFEGHDIVKTYNYGFLGGDCLPY